MKMKKSIVAVFFMLFLALAGKSADVQAAPDFQDVKVYVADDLRNFDQVVGLSWQLDWNLNTDAGVTKQNYYGKFTLTEKSIVRIKLASVNRGSFATEDYFRLYGNASMATPLTDNDMAYGAGDDYLVLEPGTYYIDCGSACDQKVYNESSSQHSTKVMIGAIPYDKAVSVTQTTAANGKSVTVKVEQKFATELRTSRWRDGKQTSVSYGSAELGADLTFKVTKNGWYTVSLPAQSTVGFDKEIDYLVYVKVSTIGDVAKKGETYKVGNLKYKLVKAGVDGKGTVMVTGVVKEKKSITIPRTVKIKRHTYKVVKINSKAFYKKSKIKNITIKSTDITSIGRNAFKGIHKKAVINVPKSKYKEYKKLITAKTGFAKKTMKIKKR